MSDPLEVTARELIASANRERDEAIVRAERLASDLVSAKETIAELMSELTPDKPVNEQRRQFACRVVDYLWRTVCNANVDEDYPPDVKEKLENWLLYRLEQWTP